MTAVLQSDYSAGLASCINALALAKPDQKFTVFKNIAREVAGFVRSGGLEKAAAVDRLNNAAITCGLTEKLGEDAIQAALADAWSSKPAEPKQRLVPIPWSKIHCLPRREAVIGGLLDRGAMSVVYGGSNTGKTFLTLDLGACIALGLEWRGRKVQSGAVVYIAAEGGLGIEERLTAYRLHHNVKAEGVPLYIIPEPIDMCRADTDVALLLKRIGELPKEPPLELIVVDTLSRAMSGGNENSPDDMGRFVRHCDHLRIETHAHVLVIHHSGKDDSRGARGHSLLKAAADTEIEVSKSETTGIGRATVAKQRDHAGGDTFGFSLHSVEIGRNADNSLITSCVVVATEQPVEERKRGSIPKAAQTALRALVEALDEQGKPAPASQRIPNGVKTVSVDCWRAQAYRRGISTSSEERARQQAFKRASEYLIGATQVLSWDGLVWLA
jgi:hypothetical protein